MIFRNTFFVSITAMALGGCAAPQKAASADAAAQAETDLSMSAGEPMPEGVAYQSGEVEPLLALPESIGKLELEYIFRYSNTGRGDLYLYGGDVLMRPEVGIVPLDPRLAEQMHSGHRKQALHKIYAGLRSRLEVSPGIAAPESMQVARITFLREEIREATWTRRNAEGEPVRQAVLPAVLAVYDIEFADGSSARSYFWLTEFSGYLLRIKMTEFPYPGLEENFVSFARQVMTSVFRGSTEHLADEG